MLETTKKQNELLSYEQVMETLGSLIAPLERRLKHNPGDTVLDRELAKFKKLYYQLQEKLHESQTSKGIDTLNFQRTSIS